MSNRILQPHELAARGLAVIKPGPATQGEITEMPISSNRNQGDMYTAEEDVTETLPDGRTVQVIGKGGTIPMQEAVKLGLVKTEQKAGPTEKKPADKPSEQK